MAGLPARQNRTSALSSILLVLFIPPRDENVPNRQERSLNHCSKPGISLNLSLAREWLLGEQFRCAFRIADSEAHKSFSLPKTNREKARPSVAPEFCGRLPQPTTGFRRGCLCPKADAAAFRLVDGMKTRTTRERRPTRGWVDLTKTDRLEEQMTMASDLNMIRSIQRWEYEGGGLLRQRVETPPKPQMQNSTRAQDARRGAWHDDANANRGQRARS